MPLPTYDPIGNNLSASQVGGQLANIYMQNNLAYQRLRSEDALRRAEEARMAQAMGMQLFQHNMMVDEQADRAKAIGAMQADMALHPMTTTVPLYGPPEVGRPQPSAEVPNPNGLLPEDAYMKYMAPVDAKWQHVHPGRGSLLDTLADYARIKKERFQMQREQEGELPPTVGTVQLPDGTTVPYVQPRKGAVHFPNAQPEVQTVYDNDGNPINVMTQGPFVRAQRIPESTIERQKLEDERQRQKLALQWLFNNDRIDLVKWDQNGRPFADAAAIQTASKAGIFTGAAKGVAEKQQMSTENALLATDSALKTINERPEAIGVAGVGRDIAERVKGQLGLDTGGSPVAKARQNLALTFTQLADGLRVDSGNMSRYERNKLELVGDPSRWQESPDTARNMMDNIQKALVAKGLRQARDLGKLPDDALLRRVEATEVVQLVADHLMSKEAAQRWWELKNPGK